MNMKHIQKKIAEIRKKTRSIHIKEILIDEGISGAITKNLTILKRNDI